MSLRSPIRAHALFVALCSGALAWALCAGSAAAAITASCTRGAGSTASLIAAINQANANLGPDTVSLGSGCVYTLHAADNYWYGPNGLPPVASDITIEGHGATIRRSLFNAPPFRLFFVGADPASPYTDHYVSPGAGKLTLRDVSLFFGAAAGGNSNGGGGGAGMGGAIFSQGTVVIERSTLWSNNARGGSAVDSTATAGGGGIGTNSSSLGAGGGFGPGTFGGAHGGTEPASGGGSGGGAGFTGTEDGGDGTPTSGGAYGGNGGGPTTGLGGAGGGGAHGGASGDGSGGAGWSGICGGGGVGGGGAGAENSSVNEPGGGGAFGQGGLAGLDCGGGGGFGGGGGLEINCQDAGAGGFGGGGGGGDGCGHAGGAGFGGGTATAAGGGGGAGMGGAVFNMQGQLTIRNSTLAVNRAFGGSDTVTDHGKGIGGAVFNLSGSFTAVDSTFAQNTATYDGNSIYNLVYDGHSARVAQTELGGTIVANGSGPGVELASNKTTYITPANLGTAVADVGNHDLVTSMAAREHGSLGGTPLTLDPKLGPLQDNGGATETMAPASGSPVVDAGSALGLTTDQRGRKRPSDFGAIRNALGGDGSDIGAFELQDVVPPNTRITAHPKKKTRKRTVQFSFASSEPGSRFQCKLDTAPYTRCHPPKQYTGLKLGHHAFQVRAVDLAGNLDPSSATFRFKVVRKKR